MEMDSNHDKFTFYIDNDKYVKQLAEMPKYVSNGSIGEVIFHYSNEEHHFLESIKLNQKPLGTNIIKDFAIIVNYRPFQNEMINEDMEYIFKLPINVYTFIMNLLKIGATRIA
jgi:hypothetical protein